MYISFQPWPYNVPIWIPITSEVRMNTLPKYIFSLPFLPQTTLLLVLLLPLIPLLLLIKKRKNSTLNLPPSPPSLPIIGNLHQLGKVPHQSIKKLSDKYGPVMLLKLGQIPTLVVSSPEMAQQVLKTHDLECCSRPNSYGTNKISYNLVDLAFCPYNDYWKQMRKLCVIQLFAVKRVQSFRPVRDTEVSKFINSISQNEGKPVNLSEEIFHLSNGIICQTAFGNTYEGKQFEGTTNLQQVMDEVFAMLSGFWAADFFPTFGWIIDRLMGLHKRLDKAFANLDAFFERIIEEHLSPTRDNLQQKDIVDILLDLLKDQTCTFRLTRDQIKALLLDIFLGGVDTMSITIAWAMSELAKNARVMKKVQAEIRNAIGKKPKAEENEIENLPYLKMVLKETFRLHPPATLLIPRETTKHCKIGGYDVFPKTRVLVGAWAIGRDPNTWNNPEEFCPERFEDNAIDFKGANFELLPFGAGRRICPALATGAITVEFILANLLYCFDWELPQEMKIEDISMEEEAGLTAHKKLPLYLVPIKHNHGTMSTEIII